MASPAKKAKTTQPVCPYGARCYRKNPDHLKEFYHPSKTDDDKTSKANTSTSINDSSLPPCKYGAKCYRKNLMHFAEFSHPTAVVPKTSGSDTDPVSDEEEDSKKRKKAKPVNKDNILNRGMSLVKKYSQMTEDERKELIKQAFEAKQKLQEELKETKDKVKEKEKELEKMQKEVASGLLLVDGEEEALKGDDTVYFTLKAERDFKEGSAAQAHFRLAESQFYRLLSGSHSNYKISKVEYVVNPKLVHRFKEAKDALKKERGEKLSYPVLAFHGTQIQNIPLICENGFKVPGESGFKHRTDTGWYGKGVYFSEFPAYSMGYIQGAEKLLLCQVLPGKVFKCTKLIHGAALSKGHDSHMSPDEKELVIFNSHRILPSYVVHYHTEYGDFKYAKDKADVTKTAKKKDNEEVDLFDLGVKAFNAKKSSIFAGDAITLSGTFCYTQAKMKELIEKHGGVLGTAKTMSFLVTTLDFFNAEIPSNKVLEAKRNDVPIVTERYLYDSILKKKKLNLDDYELLE